MADISAVSPISASPAVPNPKIPAEKTTEVAPKPGSGTPEKPASAFKGTKHTVNIDGAVDEVEYDELLAGYQREKASQKRFKEAKALEQANAELVSGLGRGDEKAWGWLKANVPKDVFKKVAFDFAYQEMEHDALPEDKKREKALDERERRLKEQEEQREHDAKAKAWQAEVQSAGQHIQKQLDEFVDKSGQKPSTEQLYRMSEYMLAYMSKNNELPSIDKLYQYTEKQLELDAHGVIKKKSSDIKGLLSWLPPDVVKAIKKSFIDESESYQPRRGSAGERERSVSRKGESKKVGIDEAFQILEKKMKQRR